MKRVSSTDRTRTSGFRQQRMRISNKMYSATGLPTYSDTIYRDTIYSDRFWVPLLSFSIANVNFLSFSRSTIVRAVCTFLSPTAETWETDKSTIVTYSDILFQDEWCFKYVSSHDEVLQEGYEQLRFQTWNKVTMIRTSLRFEPVVLSSWNMFPNQSSDI